MVELPLKTSTPALGSSREIAIRRLQMLKRRLAILPQRRKEYVEFMQEYLSLGHKTALTESEVSNPSNHTCYIPHHFVLTEESTTTKFRVVFDASAKTSNGMSLNYKLMVGANIQDSLISILIRFRTHLVVFTAHIEKMYRQIRVSDCDADFQRIVWRWKPNEPIQDYKLVTVRYGTASAPFQATRVLQQLAKDEQVDFPLAAHVTLNDFYVDDVMSGGSGDLNARKIITQLIEMCKKGCLVLRKFSVNREELLEYIPHELRENRGIHRIDTDDVIKTLGLNWSPTTDEFMFKVTLPPSTPVLTKRSLLSQMSKVFDPLGLLAPIIIRAKIIFQQLWILNIDWDEPLPIHVKTEWENYRNTLPMIENLKIPRYLASEGTTQFHLLGFCDASEKAYAAVTYIRAHPPSGEPIISLVAAKTRLAPTKTISLHRLELCGALLLSHLMTSVQRSLKLNLGSIRAWTDSTVVVAWLQAHPSRWKTFVANRVTQIQEEVPPNLWNHVSSIENPADCASRGVDTKELISHDLWWQGPVLLKGNFNSRGDDNISEDLIAVLSEEKKHVVATRVSLDTGLASLYRFSSLQKVKRLTAWCLRYLHHCRLKANRRNQRNCEEKTRSEPLSTKELEFALLIWIQKVQNAEFNQEILCPKNKKLVSLKSRILALNPVLDYNSTLRVGGRLRHAPISLERRSHATTD